MSALQKLVDRCNEMDQQEQLTNLGDAIMPINARAELARLHRQVEAGRKLAERIHALRKFADEMEERGDAFDFVLYGKDDAAALAEWEEAGK